MTTTAQAHEAILSSMPDFGTEVVGADAAPGRVLRQSVVAERDQPPFDRVMMDGIAFSHTDFLGGQRSFPVQAMQAAGDTTLELRPGHCIEIMTGAALPAGADCIVPVERITTADGVAALEGRYEVVPGRFVHGQGSDHRRGSELLTAGQVISPLDTAVIASCGLTEVEVSRLPVIRVISTGNELVPAGSPIAPQQVRLSNGPAVIAMLRQHGYADCRHEHVIDDPAQLEERLAAQLRDADVLVLSGGVSMGKADFVPQVLERLGVKCVFHGVSQRPGKPMWFGTGPSGEAVFALPGNPVSTLICCRHYVIPALAKASAVREQPPEFAALAQDVSFEPQLTLFLPARLLSNTAGGLLAIPVHTNTSGDFASLCGTGGYLELALEQSRFPAGSSARIHRW